MAKPTTPPASEKPKQSQKPNTPSEPSHVVTPTIEDMAVFCKAKGFVYPNSDIYGGLAGCFDLGHLGVELANNIKQHWWKTFVQSRPDIVGIDGSIINNQKVWKASGHVDCFEDVMVECEKCKHRTRGDHLLEEKLHIHADGLSKDDVTKLIQKNKLTCPLKGCNGVLGEGKQFNLMFYTFAGPSADETTKAYLRPETAQLMFTNFRYVTEHARLKPPFGIAQIGRAFRNEISPRDFLFRCREFEQMEIEYFVHPQKINDCPFLNEVENHTILVWSSEMQEKNQAPKPMTIKDALKQKIILTAWHGYWLAQSHLWFVRLGADPEKFRIRQHLNTEKSHYALDTWDLEYKFPFGWKELQGMANRTDFDLKQHALYSKTDLQLFDEDTKEKFYPHVVAEPSQGVGRAMLVFLFDAYHYDPQRENVVLKLHPKIAPVKVAVLSLVNKLNDEAMDVFNQLKEHVVCAFDKSGSIGRRYARNDEIGTPYCVTIDFDSQGKDVTIRDRDSTKQKRVLRTELVSLVMQLLQGTLRFDQIPGKTL